MISHSSETKRYCSEPLENIENYDIAVVSATRSSPNGG